MEFECYKKPVIAYIYRADDYESKQIRNWSENI